MYKNKPVVICKPPIWRHSSLPWGWYHILNVPTNEGEIISSDGYFRPGDGGGADYAVQPDAADNEDGGYFVDLNDKGDL